MHIIKSYQPIPLSKKKANLRVRPCVHNTAQTLYDNNYTVNIFHSMSDALAAGETDDPHIHITYHRVVQYPRVTFPTRPGETLTQPESTAIADKNSDPTPTSYYVS